MSKDEMSIRNQFENWQFIKKCKSKDKQLLYYVQKKKIKKLEQ